MLLSKSSVSAHVSRFPGSEKEGQGRSSPGPGPPLLSRLALGMLDYSIELNGSGEVWQNGVLLKGGALCTQTNNEDKFARDLA